MAPERGAVPVAGVTVKIAFSAVKAEATGFASLLPEGG